MGKITALVISHPVNFRFSTLIYLALKKKIPVYVLNYVNEYISIRKLESVDDWKGGGYEKPDYEIVTNLSVKKKNYLEKVGREYLKQVRLSKKGEVSTIGAFKNTNEDFDKNKFFKKLNLEINRPTVVILTGCWPDFPNIFEFLGIQIM